MEPITSTLTIAKEIYETVKTIQKVYNVSKEMKTVAESEGKDKIMAKKDLVGTAANMKQEGIEDNGKSLSRELKIEDDLHYDKNDVLLPFLKGDFVDKLEPVHIKVEPILDRVEFVDKLSPEETLKGMQSKQDIFVDRLSSNENICFGGELKGGNSNFLQTESAKEVVEQNQFDSSDATDSIKVKSIEGLTDQEKQEIKDKTGWSDKIINAIRTKEEAQIYIDAGLVEGEVNGKPALLQPEIDGKACNDPRWPDWSNKELAEEGYPPRDRNGRPYELHHIGQNPDSPLAELTYEQHHSGGNFKILHTFDESSIDRAQFNKERKEYWSERSKSL